MNWNWQQIGTITPRGFTCGHCGNALSSEKGYLALSRGNNSLQASIYICHHCERPTFFDIDGMQTPGGLVGESVEAISDETVRTLYEESRIAVGTGLFTSAVLASRKLLMHIAVAQGAEPGLSFIKYVEYLSAEGYIPPGARDWVDHIREKGNEANHDIVIMSAEDAGDLLSFTGMLLKIIYEFPSRVKRKTPST